MPEFGYNIEFRPDFEGEDNNTLEVWAKARKATPDVTLEFNDNARNLDDYSDTYPYGFDLEVFFADLYELEGDGDDPDESSGLYASVGGVVEDEDGTVSTRPADATRVKISERSNENFDPGAGFLNKLDPKRKKDIDDGTLATAEPGDESIIRALEYEFLAIDTTFDGISDETLEQYADFMSMFEGHYKTNVNATAPQYVLLKELLEGNGETIYTSTIMSACEEIYGEISSAMATLIADVDNTEGAWYYGAQFDSLSFSDAKYVIADDTDAGSERGDLYGDAQVLGDDLEPRDIRNSDMILGISKMQQEIEDGTYTIEGATNRVFYLDPSIYGGNYMNPAVYVAPLQNKGWLGFVDVLFPDLSPCKPKYTDLIDFGDIQEMIDEIYPTMPEDTRLSQDPECVLEVPYDRILNRSSKALLQGLISAAIRIYCSVGLIKAMPVFTKFSPRFPEVFSAIYGSYIVEVMERSFKAPQEADRELFTAFKDNEFWYAFLEQAVQMYGERIEREEIEPPFHVTAALTRLNNMQEEYLYPTRDILRQAKRDDEVTFFKSLKNYRSDENLEAVQETEEDAKIVLTELVMEQLNFMSEKIIENLDIIGWTPDIYDLDYYLLDNMTQGSSLTLNANMNPDGTVNESYIDIPTEPIDPAVATDYNDVGDLAYYTYGGEFVIGEDNDGDGNEGQEYIGYYHIHLNDDNEPVYMVGEAHSDTTAHDTLYPLTDKIYVEIGDVSTLDLGESEVEADPARPFYIEKYISINGEKLADDTAISEIMDNSDLNALLSEVYPGVDNPMEVVYDDNGTAIGITGELGVRYGLRFSIILDGTKYEITSVEMDALDLPLNDFVGINENSKRLLCLVNLLKKNFRKTSTVLYKL